MDASYWDKREIAELLINHPNIQVNKVGNFGQTALILAARRVLGAIVELLLDHPKVDVNVQNTNGWSALMFAASENNATLVKVLAYHPKIWINQAEINGETALHIACWHSPKTDGLAARYLLNHPNIEVNWANNVGQTPIFKAVHEGNVAALRLLLEENKIMVNYLDDARRTPLIYALQVVVDGWLAHEAIALIDDGRTNLCHNSRGQEGASAACVARRRDVGAVFWLLIDKGVRCCDAGNLWEKITCPTTAGLKCYYWL